MRLAYPSHHPGGASRARATTASLAALSVALSGAITGSLATAAGADEHDTVALVGSLQNELGCEGDWQPACDATELEPQDDGTYSSVFKVPAGTYEYKVAFNDDWAGDYPSGGVHLPLTVAGDARIRFTYDASSEPRIKLTPLDLAGEVSEDDEAIVAPPVRQPGSNERFYFVMTDRFANGDESNDTGGIEGDRNDHGFDPTDKGFYHGGDLRGLIEKLDYVEGLGTTAIWLTPSFKNRPVQGNGESAGYHGYWITDFTQIDPHLGTNAELEELITKAQARGIKVYFDIITNHTADVISYVENRYSYVSQDERPYTDAEGNEFRLEDVVGQDTFPELDPETSFPYTPVVKEEDKDVKVPAILNDVTKYHNRGDSTWAGESTTLGDFVGLDDIMTEDPEVVDAFVKVYQDWIDLGVDGFRIDTAKHVNFEFWEEWTTRVLEHAYEQGNEEFFMFGEVYSSDPNVLAPYIRDTDMNSVLDFGFQEKATSYVRGQSANQLKELFANDDMYITPHSSQYALPTFLSSHDMGRTGFFLRDRDEPLELSELAHSLMYLTRGQPVVYYGDEQGFVGAGGDKDARQSLFATQVEEYANQDLLTGERAGKVDRFDTEAPLYEHIAALAQLRKDHPALEQGAQVELHAGRNTYAFSRVGQDDVEYVVVANNGDAAVTAEFRTLTPGGSYTGILGTDAPLTADEEGEVSVEVPARSVLAFQGADPVAAADDLAVEVAAPREGAGLRGLVPVRATTPDNRYLETSFAYRVVGSPTWTPLGTSDNGNARVFHDVTGLEAGTLVEYRAVTVDVEGSTAADSTFASVGNAVQFIEPDAGSGEPEPVEDPDFDPTSVTVAGSFNDDIIAQPGFVGIEPVRVVADWTAQVGAAKCFTVAGANGIPADATGLTVNVTSVNPNGLGYAVVFPGAQDGATPVPAGSTVNFERGREVANAAFVALPENGKICYYTEGSSKVGLLVDVTGYTMPGSGVEMTASKRVLDTRPATKKGEVNGPVLPRAAYTVKIAGMEGVPENAKGALLNVTVTGVKGLGNLRVYPGGPVAETSTVNYAIGQDKANATLVELSPEGTVTFYSDTNAANRVHVIIDVVGWTEQDSIHAGVEPTRLYDSREDESGPLLADEGFVLPIGEWEGTPEGAAAVVLNVTAIQPSALGNLRVFPAPLGEDTEVPDASTVNYIRNRDIPNLVVVALPENGEVAFHNDQSPGNSMDLAIDVVGFMVGGGATCSDAWQPACQAAMLTKRADGIWEGTFRLPAGSYEYKFAMDGNWDVSFGIGGGPSNILFALEEEGEVSFYFDPLTKYGFNTAQHDVITLAGDLQSALGCPGNWQPECLATMLTDLNGDGIFRYTTRKLPVGNYAVKVTHGMSWDENYGGGGVPDGANISFSVTEAGSLVEFLYDPETHILTVTERLG